MLYLLYREKFDKVADFTGPTESLRTDAAIKTNGTLIAHPREGEKIEGV